MKTWEVTLAMSDGTWVVRELEADGFETDGYGVRFWAEEPDNSDADVGYFPYARLVGVKVKVAP